MNQESLCSRFFAIGLLSFFLIVQSPPLLHAEDNTATIISGTVSNHGGAEFYVGNTGTNNYLEINNSGVLTNVTFGYIGYGANANNNRALITGSGSTWNVTTQLFIGYSGFGNRLVISNGGRVYNQQSFIGFNASASNNTVLVTGAGSVWKNTSSVLISFYGDNNNLTISNSGVVVSLDGYVGYNSGADGNAALVTGSGSVWTNNAQLFVGPSSAENTLTIANGGKVYNMGYGSIGYNATGISNAVLVTGSGSVWSNGSELYIGRDGFGNRLTIASSGTVFNSVGYVGYNSNNNVVVVTGSSSMWTNRAELTVGYSGSGNQLIITNSGQVINNSASALISYVGRNVSSSNNTVLVSGNGSTWNNQYSWDSFLRFGYSGAGNQLIISNGGRVINGHGYLGYNASSSNNVAVVTGSGSVWNNYGHLFVGSSGAGNQLTISSGGQVTNALGDGIIGDNSANNVVLVTDPGSGWIGAGGGHSLVIGSSGSSNRLTITGQGQVICDNGYVGFDLGSRSNVVQVSASGSVWSNRFDLSVGYRGSENQMVISSGGQVFDGVGYVGYGQSGFGYVGSSNTVVVTGASSVWSNRSDLYVGQHGLGNRLTIDNAGKVFNANGYVGYVVTGSNNMVEVSGSNSMRTSRNTLYIGYSGANNQLQVYDRGTVLASNLVVGYNASALNNQVTISDSSLIVTNASVTGLLEVRRGTLTLESGTITADKFALRTDGVFAFETGTLTTKGTVVSNGQNFVIGNGGDAAFIAVGGAHEFQNALIIGSSASGNRFVVTNGAQVTSDAGYLGSNFVAAANTVLVTGGGSVWNNRSNLYVGRDGSENQLTIAGGGRVDDENGYVGYASTSDDNNVLVTGAGSIWSNRGDLVVGRWGDGNQLVVTNSGAVYANNLTLGQNAASEGLLTVSDGGQLTVKAVATIGGSGSGQLTINGGTASLRDITVGASGTLTLVGGTLRVSGLFAFGSGSGGAPASAVHLSGGTVVVEPNGQLQMGSDVLSIGSFVTNQSVVLVAANNFTFSAGFDNQATFILNNGQSVRVQGSGLGNSGGLFLQAGAVLTANAVYDQRGSIYLPSASQLSVGSPWTNAGPISVQGGGISGGTINNADLIQGYGAVSAPLVNQAGGAVRASGGLLSLNGGTIQNQSGGALEIESGATLRVGRSLANNGVINNLGGVLDMQTVVLTNNAVIAGSGSFKAVQIVNNSRAQFTGGQADIYGAYLNAAGATTTVLRITANFFGAFTNAATAYFKNTGSDVTFFGSFYNNGTYLSDPAINTFNGTVALDATGVLAGGAGDVFVIGGDLTSANPDGLQLAGATVEFNAGSHTFTLAGTATIGTLQLDSGTSVSLVGGDLIVGVFNAQTDQLTTAQTIYYDPAKNSSLGGQTYALNGGGALSPVPEPTSAWLVFFGIALLLRSVVKTNRS